MRWLEEQMRLKLDPSVFSSAVSSYGTAVNTAVQTIQAYGVRTTALVESIAASVETLNSGLTEAILKSTDAFYRAMPDLMEIGEKFEIWVEAARTSQVLDSAGYEFVALAFERDVYAGISRYDHQIRGALLTRRLWSATCSKEFIDGMEETFTESKLLRKRWPVVRDAMNAHAERRYNLSVPVFFAQTEGIIRDIMKLRNTIEISGGKIYILDQTGVRRKNKKGRDIEVSGLSQMLANDEFNDDEVMEVVRRAMIDKLLPKRNKVAHGQWVTYGKAQWSVKMLILLALAAATLALFEEEQL